MNFEVLGAEAVAADGPFPDGSFRAIGMRRTVWRAPTLRARYERRNAVRGSCPRPSRPEKEGPDVRARQRLELRPERPRGARPGSTRGLSLPAGGRFAVRAAPDGFRRPAGTR